jgi:pimeloyl-ACP methyl ester carboxylesterase
VAAAYPNLKEAWVIVNGLPVFYRASAGSFGPHTPAVIHLHGFAISGTYLLPSADALAAEYRTLVPDLPGYGRSIHPDKVLSIPELAQALFDFMDVLEVESATLVGNSMGCITAIEAARARPDRIDRVVLVSPAGGPHNRPVFRGVGQLALDGLREPPKMFLIAVPDYLKYGLINAARLFWAMIHYPTVERFIGTTTPTLVVLGQRDPLVNEHRILSGTANSAHSATVRIDGAAHAINYSHPQLLAHLVRQFMSGAPLADDAESPGEAIVLRQLGGDSQPQDQDNPKFSSA